MIALPEVEATELSPRESAFWDNVYERINPGQKPEWPKGGPRAWARTNADALDPILAGIIRGDDDMPWAHGLFGAQIVAGARTCDALFERLADGFKHRVADGGGGPEDNCARLSGVVKILAAHGDQRPVAIVNSLLRDGKCPNVAKEQLIAAAQQIGNEDTRRTLAELRNRESDKRVDRAAGLSERVIAARMRGERVCPNAEGELHDLCSRFLRATNERDRTQFVACFPDGFQDGFDEKRFEQILTDRDVPAAMTALELVLAGGPRFAVNEVELTAVLDANGEFRYKFVYEVDGWKVADFRRNLEGDPDEHK